MHETGIVRDLVHRVETVARDAGAVRVTGVSVWIGALSQMSAVHFREHFDEDTAGTIAEGAALDIEVSDDPYHPQSLSVMLRSVETEG